MSDDTGTPDPGTPDGSDAAAQPDASGVPGGTDPGRGSRRAWIVAGAIAAAAVIVILVIVLASGGSSNPPAKSGTKVIITHRSATSTTVGASGATTSTTRTAPASTVPVPTVATTTTTGPRTVTPTSAPGVNTTDPVALPETKGALPPSSTTTTVPLASTVKCQMTYAQVRTDFYTISYQSHLGAGVTIAFSGTTNGHAKTNGTGTASVTFSPGYATPGQTTVARVTGKGPTCSASTSFALPFSPGG
jgi:hypothetical protein